MPNVFKLKLVRSLRSILLQGLQALICFPPPQEDAPDDQLALAIFPYFFFGSTIFLVATFVVYAAIPELRNIHGVTIMSYVAAMTVAYVGLANIQMHRDNHNIYTCQGLGITMKSIKL